MVFKCFYVSEVIKNPGKRFLFSFFVSMADVIRGDLHTCVHQCFVYVCKPKISVYPPLTHTHPFGLFIRGSGYLDFHEKVFMGGVFINFATSCDSKRPARRSLNERVRSENFPVEFNISSLKNYKKQCTVCFFLCKHAKQQKSLFLDSILIYL